MTVMLSSRLARFTRFMASPLGLAATGATIGVLAALLQFAGNPANMGVCIAGFVRDIAGALGLHRESAVQYLRPEIMGIVLGSTIAAVSFREFKSRATSASVIYFILGTFAMIGALVFQGCSLRGLLRLAGGDLNALLGLAGFVVGVIVGVICLKAGFTPGKAYQAAPILGWLAPAVAVGLLVLAVFQPQFKDGGPIFASVVGTGSMHAAVWIALGAGLIIGFLTQRSRFCTMGAVRDVYLMGNTGLLSGVLGLLAAAFITNLLLGQVNFGFADQPAVQGQHLWNFLGMVLVGLAAALAGGCPTRQLILAGEGSGDAAIFLLGMVFGGAMAHNFGMVKPCVTGPMPVTIYPLGMAAVLVGLIVCLVLGFSVRLGAKAKA